METCAELSDVAHLGGEKRGGMECEVEKERWKKKGTAEAYSHG